MCKVHIYFVTYNSLIKKVSIAKLVWN